MHWIHLLSLVIESTFYFANTATNKMSLVQKILRLLPVNVPAPLPTFRHRMAIWQTGRRDRAVAGTVPCLSPVFLATGDVVLAAAVLDAVRTAWWVLAWAPSDRWFRNRISALSSLELSVSFEAGICSPDAPSYVEPWDGRKWLIYVIDTSLYLV